MNEDRRKAFTHRLNQIFEDVRRQGHMWPKNLENEFRMRFMSALEDSFQMGKRTGKGEEQEAVRQIIEEPSGEPPIVPERAAERIDPQEP